MDKKIATIGLCIIYFISVWTLLIQSSVIIPCFSKNKYKEIEIFSKFLSLNGYLFTPSFIAEFLGLLLLIILKLKT